MTYEENGAAVNGIVGTTTETDTDAGGRVRRLRDTAAKEPRITTYGGSRQPMSPGQRTRLAALIAAAVILLVGVGAVLASHSSTPKVVVSTAAPGRINARPSGIGRTDVPVAKQVALSTGALSITTPIQIVAVHVGPGTRVKAGDPILSLNPAPIQANVQAFGAQLAHAQAALAQSQQALASVPNTPDQQQQRIASQARVQADTGQVALARQVLDIASGNGSTITSPIDGVVGLVSVSPGQTVATNKTLVQILDTSTLAVTASIPLADLATVAPGEQATVTFPDLPTVTLTGTLLSVSPQSSGDGQYGTVLVDARNNQTTPIPLGVRAFVSISAPREAAVTVPRLAVFNASIAPAVYVVRDGRVKRVPVTLGSEDDDRSQILSGLRSGEQVALTGTQTLSDGDKVDIAKARR